MSGGEKKRLQLLIVLFQNPNFLILDEPTNDLDLPTLAVLEQFLSEYQGCVLIVSHDRYFMDRLVDHLFIFEGDGVIRDFPGNYTQYRIWLKDQEKKTLNMVSPLSETKEEKGGKNKTESTTEEKKKFSFKEKREFELLEQEIVALEEQKNELTTKMSSGNLDFDALQQLSQQMIEITNMLSLKENRWLELSEKM